MMILSGGDVWTECRTLPDSRKVSTGWSKTWQMQFNTSKCKVMNLGRRGNPGHVYRMGDTELENTTSEKDIGEMIHERSTVPRQQQRLMQYLVR